MPLSRRYTTEWSPLDNCTVGMDFSAILPVGVGIAEGAEDFFAQAPNIIPTPRLEIWTNSNPPLPVPQDWSLDASYTPYTTPDWFWVLDADTNTAFWEQYPDGLPQGFGDPAMALGVAIRGRAVYANAAGGVAGRDYQFRWIITDTNGNRWTRTGLVLCAATS